MQESGGLLPDAGLTASAPLFLPKGRNVNESPSACKTKIKFLSYKNKTGAAAFAAAPLKLSLGDFHSVRLFGQEVLVHVVDVVTGEFSLEVAVLGEGTDETTSVDAAPVFHVPGELTVVIVLELVEVQVDLTVLVLNHVDQEVLLFFILEILDLVVYQHYFVTLSAA